MGSPADWVMAGAAVASLAVNIYSASRTNASSDGIEISKPVEKKGLPKINDFENLQNSFKEALKLLLRNDMVKVICIHGMLGVGKTTVMANVNDNNDVAKKFDIVIWLAVLTGTAGTNKSRDKLQQDIVRRLNLNIEGDQDLEAVSHRIKSKLEGKKYLLLLDDVKQILNLDEIGIPHVGGSNGKIVLTSRLRLHGPWFSVGSPVTDRMIKVKQLSMPDAWKMFERLLDELKLTQEKKALARLLCRDCLCLPQLIKMQAISFKWNPKLFGDDSWRVWPQYDRRGFCEIFERLKKSYDRLDDAQKKCFLYCALYPLECEIDEENLLKSWVAEGFLDKYSDAQTQENSGGNTNDSTLFRARVILEKLKEASWLGDRNGYVIMEGIMRDAALDFCSNGEYGFRIVISTDKVSEIDWEKWSGKKYISLTYDVDHLSGTPKCSNLSTLFLQKNQRLIEVPNSFFEGMKELRVLDLSGTGITLIPEFKLNKIKVLCLRDCKDLQELLLKAEQLKDLDVLDIRGTKLTEEVKNNLRALDCSRT